MTIAPYIKKEVLQKAQREGMTIREFAKTYGVSRQVIYYWLGQQARKQNIYLIAEVDRLKKGLDETYQIIKHSASETRQPNIDRRSLG